MKNKKIFLENRKTKRFDPAPKEADKALFFKNEIFIKFPNDNIEREPIDISAKGVKVFIENEKDHIVKYKDQNVNAIIKIKNKTFQVQLKFVHFTKDRFGLEYMGFTFINPQKELEDAIEDFLKNNKF